MANPIRQKEIDERVGKFADKFWGAFQMTENGRVKSTILPYSFCLCWVLLALYGGCFALLNPWLDSLLQGLPVGLVTTVEALVPAAVGTAAASLVWLLPGDKRLLPAAYIWLALLVLACLITLIIMMGLESLGLILQFFGMFTLAPLALGLGSSLLAYYFYWKKRPLPKIRQGLGKGSENL